MKKSVLLYLSFLLVAGMGLLYGKQLQGANLRVWEIENLIFLLLGIPVLWLLPTAGIPQFLDATIPVSKRIYWPMLVGLGFGLLDFWIIEYVLPHPAHSSLPPYTQPFPYSLLLYFSGALEIEVFYRLIPITLFLFIFNYFKKGTNANTAFLVIAVLTSIREPLEQWPDGPGWFVVYALASGFMMNFIQALFFKNAGFIASLSLRCGHYLVWHILNGIIIQYFILNR